MPSWHIDWDDQPTAYETELAAAERQRLQDGYAPQEGHVRPVDPPCPRHGYGMVDGNCGMCVLETS